VACLLARRLLLRWGQLPMRITMPRALLAILLPISLSFWLLFGQLACRPQETAALALKSTSQPMTNGAAAQRFGASLSHHAGSKLRAVKFHGVHADRRLALAGCTSRLASCPTAEVPR